MKVNLYPRFYSNFVFSLVLFTCFNSTGLFAQADQPIFRDDFNRNALGSFWVADASWSIKNGAAYTFIDAIDEKLITSTAYSEPSYIIETAAKGFTRNYYREFRITFGQADLSNSALYQVKYTAYGGARLTLSKSVDNIFTPQVLDEVPVLPELGATQWYTFKIARYKSGLIQVYINTGAGYSKVPVLEAIDLSYTTLGHTGWHVGTEAFAEEFSVDYISAVKPGIEKPAVKEKPAEDDLITHVSVKTGKTYTVGKLNVGAKQLIDRDYTITSLPDYLKGASFIQSANGDKSITADSILSFFVTTNVIVYIAYDPRAGKIPEWLTKWTKTGDRIGISDPDVSYLEIYHKVVRNEERYYPVILGGNLAGHAAGAKTNYLVAAIKSPGYQDLQAEDAFLSGAVVANNHANYTGTGFVDFINPSNDYIEWAIKIDVPGTYNLGFFFAHAGFTDRSLLITDNGINVGTATFSRVSSSWSSWASLQGPSIFMAPGIHNIRVAATGTSGPNMDMLSLIYLDNYYPVPNANNLARGTVPGRSHALLKAYPNPFVQTTNISYTVKEKAQVNLSVYTLQGQRVQLLENRMREAGSYNVSFDGSSLAKGIYLYRLQIGTEVQTGKLVKQ